MHSKFKAGDKIIVVRTKPKLGERVYGTSSVYPKIGWTGTLDKTWDEQNDSNCEWIVYWDLETKDRRDYSDGDLIKEWQINHNALEWNGDENE